MASLGARYLCKECKYEWRTKKDVGRPSKCPRCESRRIVFDNLTNNVIIWMIGITGTGLFLWSKIDASSIPKGWGNLGGIVGIPFLILIIAMTLSIHYRNKRVLKKFSD